MPTNSYTKQILAEHANKEIIGYINNNPTTSIKINNNGEVWISAISNNSDEYDEYYGDEDIIFDVDGEKIKFDFERFDDISSMYANTFTALLLDNKANSFEMECLYDMFMINNNIIDIDDKLAVKSLSISHNTEDFIYSVCPEGCDTERNNLIDEPLVPLFSELKDWNTVRKLAIGDFDGIAPASIYSKGVGGIASSVTILQNSYDYPENSIGEPIKLEEYFELGGSIHDFTDGDITSLVLNNAEKSIEALINKGLKPQEYSNDNQCSPLIMAAHHKNYKIFEKLHQKIGKIDDQFKDLTIIETAARSGANEILEYIFTKYTTDELKNIKSDIFSKSIELVDQSLSTAQQTIALLESKALEDITCNKKKIRKSL